MTPSFKRLCIVFVIAGVLVATAVCVTVFVSTSSNADTITPLLTLPLPSNTTNNTTNNNTGGAQHNKIAFLFLTRDNLARSDIWQQFLAGHESKYSVFCHPKHPQNVTDPVLKPHVIAEHVDTCWGCIGTVEANMLMMQRALSADVNNQHFVLVSESCVPLCPFATIYAALRPGTTYMSIFQQNFERYDKIIQPTFPKRAFTKHCAQGVVFSREHAEILVNTRHNYLPRWQQVHCVDEHYFCNVLRLQDPHFQEKTALVKITYDKWGKHLLDKKKYRENIDVQMDSYNTMFSVSNKFIDLLRSNKYLFGRKFVARTKVDVTYLLTSLN